MKRNVTAEQRNALESLSDDRPLVVIADTGTKPEFTLCTRDAPGLFSYISGILGVLGFNTLSGEILTTDDGYAVDTVRGTIAEPVLDRAGGLEAWYAQLESELCHVLAPLFHTPPDPKTVRDAVVERVAATVEKTRGENEAEPLLPMEIAITDEETVTRITVDSQDTAFFLYSLSSALAMQDISIWQVEISTHGDHIRDVFRVTTRTGKPVTDPADRRRLQLSILVTKQFSHFLHTAADPQGAFTRFEELVRQVAEEGADRRLQQLLADPDAQQELARLLGASDFLWEDFIRLQYESILPLLRDQPSQRLLSTRSQDLEQKLDQQLAAVSSPEERRTVLNSFKDYESYLIDADHILQRNTDFFFLSHRLTRLAEVVVDRAFRLAWEELVEQYGTPRTAAGLAADYTVFGLGKMGGSALGYASDIELIIVYSDRGETDGARRVVNAEFFERLVMNATDAIDAKREGIFRIDLRLRPYGEDGPRAVHVESFIEYFGPTGKAHSAERLALIRLRPIAGDAELGRRIVSIRDQLVYETDSISTTEIRELRQRQAEEKTESGRYNAKFSPGALVDLEYNVQLLQVSHGRTNRDLRNPGIHATLRGLSDEGTIDPDEAEAMIRAYRFLRNVINGLRMLRGNAQDLYLPAFDTSEFLHLARRMGYRTREDLSSADQLRVDFEVETAAVRSFVERHLGQDALPDLPGGNPADLVLSEALSEERSAALLVSAGFSNPSRGVANLRRMSGGGTIRETFARLIVLAWDYLARSSDPDMALNNWERFTEQVNDRAAFFRQLLAQPRRMEIMLQIFAGSQFLADTLIREPSFLEWISDPKVVTEPRDQSDMTAELETILAAEPDRTARLNAFRRFRKREILRIGTRDICLAGSFGEIVRELSALARSIVQATLDHVTAEANEEVRKDAQSLCILAFGKLGGEELNYSSDIDLLAVYEPREDLPEQEHHCSRVFRQVVRDLSDFTRDGQAYRVDLRLRPWGNAGRLVYSRDSILRYYESEAELWELQALIKLAPVAGDLELGRKFLRQVQPIFSRRLRTAGRNRIVETVRTLRGRAVVQYGSEGSDVKNGTGGIRDIEFLLQALQMLHHSLYPQLLTGNTMAGLMYLEEAGIMTPERVEQLRTDYRFLRRIEHFLQVYDDRQLHSIPTEPQAQAKLARIVMPGEGTDSETPMLLSRLEETLMRVRSEYDRIVVPAG